MVSIICMYKRRCEFSSKTVFLNLIANNESDKNTQKKLKINYKHGRKSKLFEKLPPISVCANSTGCVYVKWLDHVDFLYTHTCLLFYRCLSHGCKEIG